MHTGMGHKGREEGPAFPFWDDLAVDANRNPIELQVETQTDFSRWRSSREPASGKKELSLGELRSVCRGSTSLR